MKYSKQKGSLLLEQVNYKPIAVKALFFGLIMTLWLYGGHELILSLTDNLSEHDYLETWKYVIFIIFSTFLIFYLLIKEDQSVNDWRYAVEVNNGFYRQFFESAPIAYQSLDEHARITVVNRAWETLTGYSREEVIGVTVRAFIVSESISVFEEAWAKLLAGHSSNTIDLKMIRKNGSIIDIRVESDISLFPCHDQLDQACTCTYYYSALFDVTETIQTEHKLKTSEQRLHLALDNVCDGLWDWQVQTSEVYFSPHWFTILGYGPDELTQSYQTWIELMHPDDSELVLSALKMYLDGISPEYVIDHRLKCKDGQWKWILTRGKVVERDDKGRAVRMIGTHVDIDQRKKMEQRLVESEQRFHLAAVAGHVAAWEVLPAKGRLLGHSTLFKLLGYNTGEIGDSLKNWLKLMVTEDRHRLIKELRQIWQNKKNELSLELRIRHKDGRIIWLYCKGCCIDFEAFKSARMMGVCIDITDQHRVQRQFQDSKEEFESLLSSLEEGVWTARYNDSEFDYLNDSFATIYDRPIQDFYEQKDLWLEVVHPDDRNNVNEVLQTLSKVGIAFAEYRILRPSGEVRWIFDRKVIINDSDGQPIKLGGVVTDITRHKDAEMSILRERQLAEKYLELVDVMVVALDTQGKINLLNRKGYEILGYDYGSLTHADWFTVCVSDDMRDKVRHTFAFIIQGKTEYTGTIENEVLTKDGDTRLMAWHNTVVFDEDGKISGTLSSGIDITEERQSQIERDRFQRELTQAQKVAAVGRLTGGIVHDFNNILTSVLGFTGLVIDRYVAECPEKLGQYMNEILIAGERARDLVDQLLRFSRSGSGFKPQRLNLIPLIKEVVKMINAPMTSLIQINLYLDPDTPDAFADPIQTHQVLLNLCINARDAMDGRGSISISLNKKELKSVQCARCHKPIEGEWINVTVTDNGKGIQKENLKKIFEPFFTTKEQGKGTGIGLSVSQNIMQQHGGHIYVESEYGKGTSFHLLFPIKRKETMEVEKKILPASFKQKPDNVSGNILVIDDEHSLAVYISELLTLYGYTVKVMHNPVEALAYFQSMPDEFDLVISDQTMPEMIGLELLQRMLSIKPGLPSILYSGNTETLDKKQAQAIGITCFISKPVDPKKFMDMVWELIVK